MASHVPFLTVRPDEVDEVKTRDFGSVNRSALAAQLDDTDADAMEAPVAPKSRLPSIIRLPLVWVLSLGLSALLYSLVADYAGYELAAVSRDLTEDWEVGALLAWKLVELSGAWFAGYDWLDIASLATLSNLPYYYLLGSFYAIDRVPCAVALVIDVASLALPFALLRTNIHANKSATRKTPNQEVAQDPWVFQVVGLLGASIYAVTIYGSLFTWLPVYLVSHFDSIRSLEVAHAANVPLTTLLFIPIGWSTAQFLFTPTVGAKGNPGITDPKIRPDIAARFLPEDASFPSTLAWNLGMGTNGWSKRAEILAKRTAVLVACTSINTFSRTLTTIAGTEAVGAAGFAGVWGTAGILTAIAYSMVANE